MKMRIINFLAILPRKTREARANSSGMAATEFALILPIMGVIFFGMLEVSDAMMAKRRVANAANTLVDLIGQEAQITTNEVDDVVVGVMRMLEPTNASTVAINIVSVVRDPDNPESVIVDWSRDNQGGVPYQTGDAYLNLDDGAIVHQDASLVVVEMDFNYVSELTNKVLGNSFQFEKTVARWPRQSAKVELCEQDPNDPDVLINCTGN